MSGTVTLFEGLFPERDSLGGVTADEVGPEIAATLGLLPAPIIPDLVEQLEQFIRRYAVLPESAYLPLATWILATHLAAEFDAFPYIALISPAKRCGKTRVLELLSLLCARARQLTAPSPAALFRMLADAPTVLLDEVEPLKAKQISEVSQAILSILNAGHRKGGAVTRCEPPKFEPKDFPVYGPKAFAAIGGLPDTLADRSLCITMQRKTQAQSVERFLFSKGQAQAQPIRALLAAWAESNRDNVRAAYQGIDDLRFLTDRDADLWMPLFAVCAVVAPDRLGSLKECAQALTGTKAADDVEDSLPLRLLTDTRAVWPRYSAHLASSDLLDRLKAMEESQWAEYEVTARKLAKWLRPFGIMPRQVRVSTGTLKGYRREDFDPVWSSYLPSLPAESGTSETTRINTEENADPETKHRTPVSD
jgi:hypothetical protein